MHTLCILKSPLMSAQPTGRDILPAATPIHPSRRGVGNRARTAAPPNTRNTRVGCMTVGEALREALREGLTRHALRWLVLALAAHSARSAACIC